MQNEFKAVTLNQAIRKATRKYNKNLETKRGRFSIAAPPQFWGPWVEVWSQFGATGPNKGDHVSYIDISFDTRAETPSPFGVEIKGGDRFISTIGPASQLVTVTGNVATEILMRCTSYSITNQEIDVRVI